MPRRFIADPIHQELAVCELPGVGNLCRRNGFPAPGIKGQQRGDGPDGRHVGHDEVLCVRGIKLDDNIVDAALGLASPGLDDGAERRLYDTAGRAPGGCPEGDEGPVGGVGDVQVGVEGILITDATMPVPPSVSTRIQDPSQNFKGKAV